MQSQLVCNGCRNVLLYPRGATSVCCAICNTITSVPPPVINFGRTEMAHLSCGGCRTVLMYARDATSVRCSCCNTINSVRAGANQFSQINCGQCHTTLMYPYGAPSVKCAICHFITHVGMSNMRVPIPAHRPNGSTHMPPTTAPLPPHAPTQTVVVENPMSVDDSGKLVSNVVVGVTTKKK